MGAGKSFSAQLRVGEDFADLLSSAQMAVDEFAETAGLDARAAARVSVVVEEVLSNALRHGGAHHVAFDLRRERGPIAIAFEDDGIAFDPTLARVFNGPDSETGGGVGLALLRSWGTRLTYSYAGGRNRLNLVLKLDR